MNVSSRCLQSLSTQFSEIRKMLSPNSVFITGSNRGIGLEFVKQFLKLRSPPKHLFAGCRNPENAKDLQAIAKEHSNVTVVKLDVTDQNLINAAKALVESTVKGQGLNLLINNAAKGSWDNVYEVTKKEMMEIYEIDAVAPLMIAQTFLPLLKDAARHHDGEPMSCNKAAIINISTGVASISENSSGGYYPYRAAKAALNMITSNLSFDLKADSILCTAIHPGWVKTEMGGVRALITTEESIKGIFAVMEKLVGEEESGKFYHGIRGTVLGW